MSSENERKSIYVDISRCIYCRACEFACAREHKGTALISVVVLDEKIAVPMNCHQCENAVCITVCTPKALARDTHGAIVVDMTKCNGCRLCVMACPHKAVQIDLVNKVVRICDLCASRTKNGKAPACVLTCPTGALVYGEFEQLIERFKEKAARDIVRNSG